MDDQLSESKAPFGFNQILNDPSEANIDESEQEGCTNNIQMQFYKTDY